MLGNDEIDKRFGTTPISQQASPKHSQLFRLFQQIARELDETLPEGRYREIAFTELETVSMWAHKSVAKDGSQAKIPDLPKVSKIQVSNSLQDLRVIANAGGIPRVSMDFPKEMSPEELHDLRALRGLMSDWELNMRPFDMTLAYRMDEGIISVETATRLFGDVSELQGSGKTKTYRLEAERLKFYAYEHKKEEIRRIREMMNEPRDYKLSFDLEEAAEELSCRGLLDQNLFYDLFKRYPERKNYFLKIDPDGPPTH